MKKKIFITGGTGFIGRKVVSIFAQTGKYELIILTRQDIFSDNESVRFVKGDILDKNSFQTHIKDSEIVLHIAGLSTGNEERIKKINVEGTRNVVDLSFGKRFIFISTENVLYSDQGAYGESKKVCERLVEKIENHLILRVSVVYGKGDKTRLGSVINWCKRWPIIFIPGNGNGLIQPIFVSDVAGFILKALDKKKEGTFVLAGPTRVSINDFIKQTGELLGKRIFIVHLPLFPIYSFVKFIEVLFKNPFIRGYQLKNLNSKRVYEVNEIFKEFEYFPINLNDGLKKTL